jgi:hypothetical protein
MAIQNTGYDARNNEATGALDQITGSTITDARTISSTLGSLNAESDTDLNGHSAWLVDGRTGAGNLTFVFEGTVDNANYFTLNAFDTAAPTVPVVSVVITTTLAKAYYVPVGGYRRVRVRVSAYTSGNVTISSRATMASATDNMIGTVAIGPTVVPGTAATNLGKQRTAVIGATDTGVEMLARAVTSATAVTNTQLDVPQLEAATGAMFVNSPTAATAILKARAAAPGATDAGVEILCESLTANTAVTTAQYHRPQLEAATGGLYVRPIPSTVNGLTNFHLVVAATTNATNVKASAGCVYGWTISNKSAAIQFFKIFNKASAPVTGTDTPIITVAVAALTTESWTTDIGIACSLGIGIAYTNLIADLDNTAVAAADAVVGLFYK